MQASPMDSRISEKHDRIQSAMEMLPDKLAHPAIKTFRAPMTPIAVADNRMRLIMPERQGKRVILRMRIDLYGNYKARQQYQTLRRAAVVLSCRDAAQAESVIVSMIRMGMAFDGLSLRLDPSNCNFEKLDGWQGWTPSGSKPTGTGRGSRRTIRKKK